jgi:hypothetical protein
MATLLPTSADAGSGSNASVPLPGVKVTTGLSLNVNTEWVDGNGYRPVTISISPLGGVAAPADRVLDVTLRPRGWRWRAAMPSVSTTIMLEQGQTVAEKTVAVPQFQTWGTLEITTYEDGRRRDDLSADVGLVWSGNSEWSEAAPTMLFLDSDLPRGGRGARLVATRAAPNSKRAKRPELLPDVRTIASLFVTENAGNGLTSADFDATEDVDDNGLLRFVDKLGRIEIVRPDSIPKQWVQLTSIDFIFVSMDDLQSLNGDPERWEALRAWLSTGSTLCVYDVGEDFSDIPELERLFELNSADQNERDSSVDDFLARGWAAPNVADYSSEVHAVRGVQWNNQGYMQPQLANANPSNRKKSAPRRKPDDPKPFLIRGVDHGHLVALADANPFPGKQQEWCWLLNTVNNQDWMWYQRHGMSLHRDNPQYWNLLIPGVGSAPVNSFIVLISLFVVAIGPVNYFLLHRRRKLYLLLLTVPLGAGVVTSALFTYALVSDGLGVRARARSLTRIDQTNGRTVSWSRQSYYAGLAPSAGMSFPVDAAVYPLDHRPTGRYGRPKELGRRIHWGSEQRLSQGYLNSRSTAQVMVIESRATSLGIDIDEQGVGSATPEVTNRLGVDIEQLLIRSSDDRSLACDKLPAGRSVQLHEVDEEEFPTRWNKLFAAERPKFPVGFDPNQVENAAAIFGDSSRWWQQIDRGLPAPTTATSILERGLRNIGNLKLDAMRPRSYIAIVRRSPNAALGIAAVAEEASFHIVTGKW